MTWQLWVLLVAVALARGLWYLGYCVSYPQMPCKRCEGNGRKLARRACRGGRQRSRCEACDATGNVDRPGTRLIRAMGVSVRGDEK